ncbi:aminopeptidase N-like isoform X2 [Gouania willdenowi]|nr:aminopeptidase N-like isoform X2 [Gouania willdenowi]XP_028305331.1 aminopeptidase N-like isoform X2 [Gouania willdenowi]
MARLSAAAGDFVPDILSCWLQTNTQYLVVHLSNKLKPGHSYQLYTEFRGELADDLAGFYRSEYIEDGVRKIVAISQMHPTHARKTFPCFDEPAMKAVFHITLLHTPGSVALSNGLEKDVLNITVDGVNVTQTVFEPTEKMSSYLLAFVVSDYTPLQTTHGDTLMRVWARTKAIEQGQGAYALNVSGPILDFLQLYYNISYPLKKADQVAVPDFYFGAMENWGLVMYRETKLLYDPMSSSNGNKETTVAIIAHELAHMWFGNLVTLRWWNEVWLNEGFASYVSYLGADHAEPTWNIKDLIFLNDIQGVLEVDSLSSSHPLSSEEDSIVLPEQILAQFDIISYSKGAAVLRMLSDFLSESVFVEGLRGYLTHFSYSNTVGTDLWEHLQMVVENNSVSLPQSVGVIMNPWVLQEGYPLVTIDTIQGKVSQRRFILNPEEQVTSRLPRRAEWAVPLRWMKDGEAQTEIWWLMEKEDVNLDMRSRASWVLANVNMSGFYRVNYDFGNWERLLTQLNTDHQIIPLINRAQLIDDLFNLARAQVVPTPLALRASTYLQQEKGYIPWRSALNNLQYLYLMLDRTEAYPLLQDYLRKLITPLYIHYNNTTDNWRQTPEQHMDQYNQVNVLHAACRASLSDCVSLTSDWFRRWMDNPENNTILPNLRPAVYCSAVSAGGNAEWEFTLDQFTRSTVSSERSHLLSALSCSSDAGLLHRLLSFTLSSSVLRWQDGATVIASVAENRHGNNVSWTFIREHWEHIHTHYGSSIISEVTERFSTPDELQQLKDFVEQVGLESSSAVEQVLERTRANIRWLQHNKEPILHWLQQNQETVLH